MVQFPMVRTNRDERITLKRSSKVLTIPEMSTEKQIEKFIPVGTNRRKIL